MTVWQKALHLTLIGGGLLTSMAFPSLAHSQEATDSRKMIYMFSAEFPPNVMAQYPRPPIQETKFWQLLDKEISASSDLAMTETMEDADYQVELRCGGILNCTRLIVDVKDSKRTLLTSFNLSHFSPYGGLGKPKLDIVAHQLTQKLDERLNSLQKGGYGFTE
jgi:hypothetical protein